MDLLQSFGEIQSMLRRRIVLLIGLIAIGVLLSLMYALNMPRLYQASAVIQIEQPRIQDPTATNVSLNAATLQKLQILKQRVMARDNILDIVNKFNLFAGQGGLSDSEKVDILRESSNVTNFTDPSTRWRQDISPIALNITVQLGNPVLAAKVANELVNNVLEQNALRRGERTREALEFFEGEAQRIDGAIDKLEAKIAIFKIENEASLPGGLQNKRDRLASLRQIELEIGREIVGMQGGFEPKEKSILAVRLTRMEEERALYRQEADDVEASIRNAPEIEQTLNTLQRELQKLTDQYLVISRNRAEAEMGQMLEASQQSESFQILEPALVPEFAISPHRKRTMSLGALASVGLAILTVLLLEMRSNVIWTGAQLERQLGIRPVVSIPVIEQLSERRKKRFVGIVSIASFAALYSAVVVFILRRNI